MALEGLLGRCSENSIVATVLPPVPTIRSEQHWENGLKSPELTHEEVKKR